MIVLCNNPNNTNSSPMTMVKKMACFECNGRGSSTSHVEPDGGGFTSDEWSEMDDEFREGYFAGHYDRACNVCNGTGKVDYVEPEWFMECQSCGISYDEIDAIIKEQFEADTTGMCIDTPFDRESPYCSEKCYWLDYRCNCGKSHCGYCA